MDIRSSLRRNVKKAIKNLQESGKLPPGSFSNIKIERPSRGGQGDYATSIAMQVASFAGRKPKTVAKIIASELEKNQSLFKIFSEIRVAPPGFINFYLADSYLKKALGSILKEDDFAKRNVGKGKKVNLEFVSVNPTGELHIGHGRGAFYGDVLANILQYAGFRVTREYYLNNARQSAQIKELGKTALRKGTSYKSPYLDSKLKQHSAALKKFKQPATAGYFLASKIQSDIKKFLTREAKIKFDIWTEEEKLYKSKAVERALRELKKKKLTYEKDGALWLKTKKYGDKQDQVLVRSNGENTYFMADIAYHRDKTKRGFDKLIDIWGADHQGHIKRMQAAMRSLGLKDLEILISQLITLKGRMKLSKRKGVVISLSDLVEAVGLDSVRYFYLTKSLDSQMEFDLKLAKLQSQKNPVFYIQYTYARCCSILRNAQLPSNNFQTIFNLQFSKKIQDSMKETGEMELIKKLLIFPDIIEDIAQDYQVHRLTTYVHELAQEFNQFYRDFKVLVEDEDLRQARLILTAATGMVIKQCLDLLGISAPSRM